MYRRQEHNYTHRVHGKELLNSTLNGTFVSGYALEVTEGSFTMATAWSNAAEVTSAMMGTVIEQAEETLQQVRHKQENYNAYQVLS